MEREAFRVTAAPALKQILDARGVAFGYLDVRSEFSVEELQTSSGVEAILVRKHGGSFVISWFTLPAETMSTLRGFLFAST